MNAMFQNGKREVANALTAMTRIYSDLSLKQELVSWELTVKGTQNRTLTILDPNKMPFRQALVAHVPTVNYRRTLPIEEWQAGMIDLAIEAVIYVIQRFGWEYDHSPFRE